MLQKYAVGLLALVVVFFKTLRPCNIPHFTSSDIPVLKSHLMVQIYYR